MHQRCPCTGNGRLTSFVDMASCADWLTVWIIQHQQQRLHRTHLPLPLSLRLFIEFRRFVQNRSISPLLQAIQANMWTTPVTPVKSIHIHRGVGTIFIGTDRLIPSFPSPSFLPFFSPFPFPSHMRPLEVGPLFPASLPSYSVPFLAFPSLPFILVYPVPSPPFPSEVGPWNPARSPGERCNFPEFEFGAF